MTLDRIRCLLILALAAFSAGLLELHATKAQEAWREYRRDNLGFRIEMPGEPAINPVPRRMIAEAIADVAAAAGRQADVDVEVSIPGGEALAARTLNGRLGIVGGLSILGTTGIVVTYSCSERTNALTSLTSSVRLS